MDTGSSDLRDSAAGIANASQQQLERPSQSPDLHKRLPALPGGRGIGKRRMLREARMKAEALRKRGSHTGGPSCSAPGTSSVAPSNLPAESSFEAEPSVREKPFTKKKVEFELSKPPIINSMLHTPSQSPLQRLESWTSFEPVPLRLKDYSNNPHSGDKHQGTASSSLQSNTYELSSLPRQATVKEPLAELPSLPPRKPSSSPDGGWLAWAHAWGGFLVIFNCWGLNFSFGVLQDYYVRTFLPSTAPSRIAWIGSTQLFLIFVLGLPIGRAVDAGHFRIFFNVGSVLLVLAIFCTSFCTNYWQLLLVQGIITGLGMGMIFCSGLVVLMTYFKTKIGLAMGIGAAGSSVGGIVYTLIAQKVLQTSGFPWTMRCIGFVSLATMIVPNIIFRVRLPPRKQARPADWSMLRDRAYMVMTLGMFFAFWGLYFGFYYIIPYATLTLNISFNSATNILLAMLAANLPGRFIPAIISDRCLGPLNTLIPSTLLATLLMFLWPGAQTQGALTLLACAYGFAAAGVQSLYAITLREFASPTSVVKLPRNFDAEDGYHPSGSADRNVVHGTEDVVSANEDDRLGLRSGFTLTVIGVACLTGTPLGGALVERGGDKGDRERFLYAQVFAGSSLAIAAVCFTVSRVLKVGWRADRA